VRQAAAAANLAVDHLSVISPLERIDDALAERFKAARRSSSLTLETAKQELADPLVLATALLLEGEAAGLLAGVQTTTAETITPALRVRTLRPGLGPVTSCFIMSIGHAADERVLVFSDCALNPEPSAAMLVQIAIAAGRVARKLCALEPRVALLSFSTHGSAEHARVAVVREAAKELRRRAPDLAVDGELQVDAALVESVASQKAPTSSVAGRANVLIFPSLEAGNIGYKLVERLAGARAIGPIFSGLNWPVNDLSRGCSVDDAIDMLAVTSIMAHER
jgi:phosphate acetyltransferase